MELTPKKQARLDKLLGVPKPTKRQRDQIKLLLAEQEWLRSRAWPGDTHTLGTNEPRPAYKPLNTYPKTNTRVNPRTDVLYKSYEDYARSLPDVNKQIDYDWIARNNPEIRKQFPKGPLETSHHYVERIKGELRLRKQNLDLLNTEAVYNPTPTKGFFEHQKFNPNQRQFTTLDIETDDFGRPISISASRLQWDPKQKKFVNIDSYQRFYLASNADLIGTFDVHGMTAYKLASLRNQQGATYRTKYDDVEQRALLSYIGGSTIVGHNIAEFDLNKLFPGMDIGNSTIDTLLASRSVWKGQRNDLDTVFYRLFGKTMEQAGLPHHDPNADTIASAMIAEKLANIPGYAGRAIRYVMNSQEQLNIAEYDAMLESMITRGSFRNMFGDNNLNEVYMSNKDAGLVDAEGKQLGSPGELEGAGIHIYDTPGDVDSRVSMQSMQEEINLLAQIVKKNDSSYISHVSQELAEEVNSYNKYHHLDIVKRVAQASTASEIEAIGRAYGDIEGKGWQEITAAGASWRKAQEDTKKSALYKKIKDYRDDDRITAKQYKELHKVKYLAGSYDDLADAMDKIIKKNKELMDVFELIGKIKPYDINQYIGAAKGQWSGIMGASRGVVPSFIRNPISRLGDATFNAIDRSVSPWNALNRTWNSGIGNVVTAGLGAVAGPVGVMAGLGITGTVNAVSQIAGNYQQSKLEMAGLNIQNNLNTLGAMISWISTPFQLLHKALKLAIGSLGGFSLKLNNIMGGGINLMSQMGNPLEQMTGVDYIKYQGTMLTDLASLQSKGSTNAAIESFATMQRNLYRFGQVDTNKLLAANMLGVFNEAFSPSTDTEGAYYSMGNKILHNMMGQSASQQADTLYYVNQLNSNLAQTIRSALMMGVTDLRQLTDPSAFHQMYWRPISDTEEGQFRKTQYEYGVATQQFGYSKMRFADRLWNAVGRDIYNGLNQLVDKAAVGDWRGVLESAGNMWDELKAKVKGVWEGKDGKGGVGDKITSGLSSAWDKIKVWAIRIANGIIDIWDQIFLAVAEKAQGLIAYLSTVQVDFVKDKKTGKWGIDISTIGSVEDLDLSKPINTSTGAVYKGMEYLDKLASQYIPYYDENKQGYRVYTGQDLVNALTSGVIKDGVLDTPEINLEDYGLSGYRTHSAKEAYDLLNMLWKGDSGGTGYRKQAAMWIAPEGIRSHIDASAYRLPITDMFERLIDSGQEIRYEAANHVIDTNKDEKITVEFKGLGDQPITATRENGKWKLTGMNPLQSVKLYNGAARASVQVQ